ncbi:hypothetical protein OE88DRAFT_875523 [Heliocybe sulcata]|uniref:G-patch domain-containing protein n=1 Tax=Heliocybe sulcata TaxID=5364 RepID=A0A5C3MYP4_9AGAM|nr:hypothetical protein OE88DRAFT_875523 [Heliocybe sulcata]
MSAPTPTVSFTIRRPTPVSRNSSEPDSDSASFKIPAIPRHVAASQSAPGSPLARSANASPKLSSRTYSERDSSDEEDEEIDELVTGFDQFGAKRCVISRKVGRPGSQLTAVLVRSLHEKKKPQGPLVIPALKNRDWREFAKKRKQSNIYVPASAQATTGADGSVGGLGTRDSINSGPQKMGLQVKQMIKMEEGDDAAAPTTTEVDVKMEEDSVKEEVDEDQRALRAILASVNGEGGEDGPTIDAIRPMNEGDAYKQDVAELPDEASLADYERVPVSQFGAAMLRGMGWKEGQAASRKQKGPVEPWMPQSRPALLGIGAKEREALDDGSGKTKKRVAKGAAMKYVPVVKKEREGSGRGSGSGSPTGNERRRDRDDRRNETRSEYGKDRRERERDYERERSSDRRRYDDGRDKERGDNRKYDRSDRRDREGERPRESRRDYDRSDRDRDRDDDRRRRRDRRDA